MNDTLGSSSYAWLPEFFQNLSFVWWYAIALLPVPFILFIFRKRNDEAARAKAIFMPTYANVSQQMGRQLPQSKTLKWLFLAMIWICLVIAVMRPVYYGEPIAMPNEGRDLMIAVDLSGSMQTKDMRINNQEVDRLVMVKSVLSEFIQQRVGDRLGLILFADTAYLQAPLTFDRNTVATLLEETVIGLVGESTAIGDAIGLAVKRYSAKPDTQKVLILLTDGQNTAGNITPEQALELAVSEDVTIYPIGVGADVMMVNSLFGQRQINPSAELDERLLNDLAKATGGQYFRARDTEELANIYALLNRIEPIADETQTIRPQSSFFYYFAGLALALWGVYICLLLLQKDLI